jgi:hypothetical protein
MEDETEGAESEYNNNLSLSNADKVYMGASVIDLSETRT